MHLAQFTAWCLRHCPGLFDGTRHWILSCIHGEHGQHTHSEADAAHDVRTQQTCCHIYHVSLL